jgi:hypothetical protein
MTIHDVLHPTQTVQHLLHDVLRPTEVVHHWVEGHIAAPIDSIYARIDEDLAA